MAVSGLVGPYRRPPVRAEVRLAGGAVAADGGVTTPRRLHVSSLA